MATDGNQSPLGGLPGADRPSRGEIQRRINSLYDRAESDSGTFNATRALSLGTRGGGGGRGSADRALDAVTQQWFDAARNQLGPTVPAILPRDRMPQRPAAPRPLERPREAAPVLELEAAPRRVPELPAGAVAALPAAPERRQDHRPGALPPAQVPALPAVGPQQAQPAWDTGELPVYGTGAPTWSTQQPTASPAAAPIPDGTGSFPTVAPTDGAGFTAPGLPAGNPLPAPGPADTGTFPAATLMAPGAGSPAPATPPAPGPADTGTFPAAALMAPGAGSPAPATLPTATVMTPGTGPAAPAGLPAQGPTDTGAFPAATLMAPGTGSPAQATLPAPEPTDTGTFPTATLMTPGAGSPAPGTLPAATLMAPGAGAAAPATLPAQGPTDTGTFPAATLMTPGAGSPAQASLPTQGPTDTGTFPATTLMTPGAGSPAQATLPAPGPTDTGAFPAAALMNPGAGSPAAMAAPAPTLPTPVYTGTTGLPTAPLTAPGGPLAGQGGGSVSKVEKVVAFARAQVGKPCVWGAKGPDSYDCSGLTQAAWKAAGVPLPRSAADQAQAGMPVDLSDLRPGDLIFFFDDLRHTGLCTGNGTMVHAPGPGAFVREESIFHAGQDAIRGAMRPA